MNDKKRLKKEQREKRRELNRQKSTPPNRTILEEIGSSISHGVGAFLSIVALILLLLESHSGLSIMASLFYGISLFFAMLMSCLYHAFKLGSRIKRIWRRFDYSSIYLLIGGTFAPIFLIYWGNFLGITLFCVQWGIIVFGITMISVFGPGRLRGLHFALYFALGWSAIMFIPDWIKHNMPLFLYILLGGISYTLGMIPFCRKTRSAHFVWHLFVLMGAVIQFFGIYIFIY